jgi:histidinol-phosphatase (PHP family)
VNADLHVHSTCSGDGSSRISEYVHRASEIGLAEVGFCEHADFDPRDWGYNSLDLSRYDREIAAGRAVAPGVKVRQGVEITYQSRREAEIRNWVDGRNWDYVMISVHLVDYEDGWAIISDSRTMNGYFATHDQRQAYGAYFEELLRATSSGVGDIVGHLDLVKRYGTSHYGPFEPAEFREEIGAILRAAIQAGVGLEINTSGLAQQPGEPYPGLEVLRWYRELGGEVLTVGSDAHHVDRLGAGIDAAEDLARQAGFRAIATFENQRLGWIDL